MNKVELSKQISSKMSIKQVEALRFIHTLEEVFEEALLTDNSIIFQNFCLLYTSDAADEL